MSVARPPAPEGRIGRALRGWAVDRRVAAVLALGMVVHLAHQAVYRRWYLEDAAIVFAYARNVVNGDGLVPWPGGERVEGYSDPLWLALVAGFHAVGVEGWTSGKLLAAFFGAGSLVLAWRLAREAIADPEDERVALVAPLALAANAFHAIWSASALENALFTFLLLGGALRVVREVERPGLPWSAILFLLLSLTRPDGLLYAALAGAWFLLATWRDGRGLRPSVAWFVAFWGPYGALVAARIAYFAFPLPNTYYAKLGEYPLTVGLWHARGWSQLREYAQVTWTGWFLPVYVLGLLGTATWRRRVAWAVLGVLGVALLIPGPDALRGTGFWPDLPEPQGWLVARIALIAVVGAGLPFVGIGGRGWLARGLVWHFVACAAFFSVYSNGDWTRGLRWMSLFSGTAAVLFAVGVHEVLALVRRWEGGGRWTTAVWFTAAMLVGLQFPPHLSFSRQYERWPDDAPTRIRNRVAYTSAFARRVWLDEPVRALDMDMGAHLWWSDHHMVDMAGLVDIPIALHTYEQRDFVQQYVFDEQKPHFAYCQTHWAEETGFKSYPGWDETYFRLPGYIEGEWNHFGVYARRDMLLRPSWEGPKGRRVPFARGVVLEGFDVPALVGAGVGLAVEVGFRLERERLPSDPFQVVMFLADAKGVVVATWELAMGLGVLPPHQWDTDEVFRGRYTMQLDKAFPPGVYDLGFFVTGGRGYGLAAGGEDGALPLPEGVVVGGRGAPAVYATGEARFPGAVTVVSKAQLDEGLGAVFQALGDAVKQGACDDAEARFTEARRMRPLDPKWQDERRAAVAAAMSRCWTKAAEQAPEQAVQRLERAAYWDRDTKAYRAAAERLAEARYARGEAAMASEDWATAYAMFSDVLKVAPHWSWARRYAEQSRDHLLGRYDEQGWTWRRLGPY